MSASVDRFIHLEIVHPDPDAAAAFTVEVLGAKIVETQTAAYVEGFLPGMRLVHTLAGNVVFQFVRPADGMQSWVEQLEREGPSLHNITFTVGDLPALRTALEERGATILVEWNDVDMRPAGMAGEPFHSLMVDARQQIGLRLELLETKSGWPPLGAAP